MFHHLSSPKTPSLLQLRVSSLSISISFYLSLSLSFPRRLNFSLLCFIAFILLRLFFVLSFPPYPASSFAIASTSNGKKTEKTARGVLVSHFFRHCLKKNNNERERGGRGENIILGIGSSILSLLRTVSSSSRLLALVSYNFRSVVTKFPTAPCTNSLEEQRQK